MGIARRFLLSAIAEQGMVGKLFAGFGFRVVGRGSLKRKDIEV